MSNPNEVRFREALRGHDVAVALGALASSLKNEGFAQLQLYELFSWFQQRLSPEDPRYDAVVDTMDLIYGGPWAKGKGLFTTELRPPPSRSPMREPWAEIHGGNAELEREALLEIGLHHELWGVPLVAVGRKLDGDDVLFAFRGRPEVAEVHLTWSGKREQGTYPRTRAFPSMLEWFDHAWSMLEGQ